MSVVVQNRCWCMAASKVAQRGWRVDQAWGRKLRCVWFAKHGFKSLHVNLTATAFSCWSRARELSRSKLGLASVIKAFTCLPSTVNFCYDFVFRGADPRCLTVATSSRGVWLTCRGRSSTAPVATDVFVLVTFISARIVKAAFPMRPP